MSAIQTEAPHHPPGGFLAGYSPLAGTFDECLGEEGAPRSHWAKLAAWLMRLGPEELRARGESARRILREHGVTYNIYGDVLGMDRPWELDLVPLVLPAGEWQGLESALIQRARLLNALLDDWYGPQRLVQEQVLPPALVQAHPHFLRAGHGIRPPANARLIFSAIDLARGRDGRWWALADRTQSPLGAGYALENRTVMLRVLPEEFRDCQVQRLTGFFDALRQSLYDLALRHREHPNVVVLTPGPHHEAYFEHVYLARHLGFPLVEGADLTVRERQVCLKTLEGLQPVDVIWRRMPDSLCDPLELSAGALQGIPGLADATRAGHLLLANALGTGVVESPALLPFLPAVCRHLLGEELRLPSPATWWCGQSSERRFVEQQQDRFILREAFPGASQEPTFGGPRDTQAHESLLRQLRNAPWKVVGQQPTEMSVVPVWTGEQFEPRPFVLRVFVCASAGSWRVLPGGLVRVAQGGHDPSVSMQSGGASKDVWILGEGSEACTPAPKPAAHAVRLERAAAEVPSRVADNLFWLGRYAERLEDTVRILRCVLTRLVGEGGYEESAELSALVRLLVRLDLLPARLKERASAAALEREILLVIHQSHRLGTVREVLDRLRNIAFVVRDRLSADTWRILNRLQSDARVRPGRLPLAEALALLNTLVVDLAAFSGLEMENMTRGHGWRFLDLGRRLERAMNVATLTQAGLVQEREGHPVLQPMLEIGDSVMTYRRRYFAPPQLPAVLDLLLVDETNPRSLAFQLDALNEHVAELPGPVGEAGSGTEPARLAAARDRLHALDLKTLELEETTPASAAIETQLGQIAEEVRRLSDEITHRYFSHARLRAS